MLRFLFPLLFLGIVYAFPSDDGDFDNNIFPQRAFGFKALLDFNNIFTKFNYPSDTSAGKTLYDDHKQSDFESNGKATIILQLEPSKVSEVLDLMARQALFSSSTENELKSLVNGSPCKTIRETVFVRDNGKVVYGLVGVVNFPKIVSLFYVFQEHAFSSTPEVSLELQESNCRMWGFICPYKFTFSQPDQSYEATGDEAEDLHKYLKQRALDQFKNDNTRYVDYLENESFRFRRFLPDDVRQDLDKIEASPDKQPDEVCSQDPLRAERYESIGK